MPGSGIGVNYLEARRNLRDVRRAGTEVIQDSLEEIAAHINTLGEGTPVLVFNTLWWPRTEVVEMEAQLPGPAKDISVSDAAGKAADTQLLSMDPATHRGRFLLLASAPALGYKIYFVRGVSQATPLASTMKATVDALENDLVRVKIDPRTGCMTGLLDKRSNQESLAPAETETGGPTARTCGNLLQTFVDRPKEWDAWNIDADFVQRPLGELPIQAGVVRVHAKPNEIKTVKVRFTHPPISQPVQIAK
jgi:alpha-mannosidase